MSNDEKKCVVCHRPLQPSQVDDDLPPHWKRRVKCPACGVYGYFRPEGLQLERLDSSTRARLAGVIREATARDVEIELRPDDVPTLLSQAPESFDVATKARKLLRALGRASTFAGEWRTVSGDTDLPLAYAATLREFIFLCQYATQQKWLEASLSEDGFETRWLNLPEKKCSFRLTASGWEETQRRLPGESEKAFVAMWFNDATEAAWQEGLKPAIEAAGYRAVRIDAEEFNGDIVDRILAEIKEARFVVADLTTDGKGDRGGVYFEAGFGMGLGLEVIFTFHESEGGGKGPHFDVAHYNQVRYADPAELREKLYNRIRATIGRGPLPTEQPAST